MTAGWSNSSHRTGGGGCIAWRCSQDLDAIFLEKKHHEEEIRKIEEEIAMIRKQAEDRLQKCFKCLMKFIGFLSRKVNELQSLEETGKSRRVVDDTYYRFLLI